MGVTHAVTPNSIGRERNQNSINDRLPAIININMQFLQGKTLQIKGNISGKCNVILRIFIWRSS